MCGCHSQNTGEPSTVLQSYRKDVSSWPSGKDLVTLTPLMLFYPLVVVDTKCSRLIEMLMLVF